MTYWIVHIVVISIFSIGFFKHLNGAIASHVFLGGLIVKLTSGMILGWVFIHHYGEGDTILFFEKSKKYAALPLDEYLNFLISPTNYETTHEPRVVSFTKIVSFFTRVSSGSYWITSMYLSLVSFFASSHLVVSIIRCFPNLKKIAVVCFLFIPSVVFWSSGILKDTLAYSAIVLLVGISLKAYHRKATSIIEWGLGLLGLIILYKIKHYLLVSYLIFIGLLLFFHFIQKAQIKQKFAAIAILSLALVSSQFVHPYLKFDRLAQSIYENNNIINARTEDHKKLDTTIDSPSIGSILIKVPSAALKGLFRPAIFDSTTPFGIVHRIENCLLTILFSMSLLLIFKQQISISHPLILAGTIVILLLATMLALTTPNFGSLVRYKNSFLPFLFFMSSILPFQYFSAHSSDND